ncbi:DUF1801 domain-containing protein [Methylomonas sp. LW13]|uniref:DUF1801 domain-containing protein n=1 Tax=unclassified Methylomonas TaxID=2608980 RepID=UPI00051AFD45|nr:MULTISPECIES: DUF1801 domain-containing protein [unclassified Methylomonas]PKD39015.1 DUF1801 domain-containing protein [Methylomonas sp. Kb3]QBC29265.1 DUF1801 domain-containing protein [Methylomonas sp. LW13]
MKQFLNTAVKAVFDDYPLEIRRKMLVLREAIFAVAASEGVGQLEETLKWGEPAYMTAETGCGSTIRMAWKKEKPNQYAMYFICTTNLVETFRTLFPHQFKYEGNRAIVFRETEDVDMDSLSICIAMALTYHRNKRRKQS